MILQTKPVFQALVNYEILGYFASLTCLLLITHLNIYLITLLYLVASVDLNYNSKAIFQNNLLEISISVANLIYSRFIPIYFLRFLQRTFFSTC